MALWLQFLIRRGLTSSRQRLISEETFQSIFHPEMAGVWPMSERDLLSPRFPVSDVTVSYNLAWITSYYRGMYHHDLETLLLESNHIDYIHNVNKRINYFIN